MAFCLPFVCGLNPARRHPEAAGVVVERCVPMVLLHVVRRVVAVELSPVELSPVEPPPIELRFSFAVAPSTPFTRRVLAVAGRPGRPP